ncbi:MAG: signal peptidase I [Candidatus Margulisiibacteriota bacterium]
MIQAIKTKLKNWETYKKDLKAKSLVRYFLVDVVETVVVALAMALLIRTYIVQTSLVPTGSMIPTMMVGDRLFVNKFVYFFEKPKRSEIVVFKSPFHDGKDYVKRCIGLPGETVQLIDGELYINGKLTTLPGVNIQNDGANYGPITVPADSYFMLGDNRANSLDSRYWGFVPSQDLLGRAFFTFWPLDRMQVLR